MAAFPSSDGAYEAKGEAILQSCYTCSSVSLENHAAPIALEAIDAVERMWGGLACRTIPGPVYSCDLLKF